MIISRKIRDDDRYVDLRDGIVRKVWKQHSIKWLERHVAALEHCIPERLVSYGTTTDGIYVDMAYVSGIPAVDWNKDSDGVGGRQYLRSLLTFWIVDAARTFPYAHWDWHSGNTIVCQDPDTQFTSDTRLALIDWDKVRVVNSQQLRSQLWRCIDRSYGQFLDEDAIESVNQLMDQHI